MNSHLPKPGPRGRQADGSPHPIDIHVGNRVRLRRVLLGMSQEDLASRLGITFQQVQKYERGLNRIGASRLWDIMQILGVDANYFFMGMDEEISKQSPRNIILSENLEQVEQENPIKNDIMQDSDFIKLAKAYERIKDTQAGEHIRGLIFSVSKYYREPSAS